MRLATLLGPDLKQTLEEDPGELLEALDDTPAREALDRLAQALGRAA